MKPKLLLHTCCAPCGGYLLKELTKEFDIIAYFNNPNLDSTGEYRKRLNDVKRYCSKLGIELVAVPYDHQSWLAKIEGLENEPEGGKRCSVCFRYRLTETARHAKEKHFDYFGTTLTISPYKNSEVINNLSRMIGKELDLKFLDRDFKQRGEFQKSCEISKKESFYQQNYCGCEFSKKAKDKG